MLLFAVTSEQESGFNSEFKLKTCNNLSIKICCNYCENSIDIEFLLLYSKEYYFILSPIMMPDIY